MTTVLVKHFQYSSVLMVLMLFPMASFSQGSEEAALVLERSYELLATDCDYQCSYEVAGLYTDNFLQVVQASTLKTIGADPDPDRKVQVDFGGDLNSFEQVRALNARELYAWILRQQVKSELHFTKVVITHVQQLSSHKLQFTVVKSGVKNHPKLEEKDTFRLTNETGEWRIDL